MKKCEECGKEYRNVELHKKMKHGDSSKPSTTGSTPKATVTPTADPEQASVQQLLGTIVSKLDNLDKRVFNMETRGRDKFKEEALPEDIERARAGREIVEDPKVVAIVDEILGEDFGIRIEPDSDRPGFNFSVVVPERLSDKKKSVRPIRKDKPEHPRDYEVDPKLKTAVVEEYFPEDVRSKVISSLQSYDQVRQHCEKVRSYIVSYFQKLQKPIPEFKLRQ